MKIIQKQLSHGSYVAFLDNKVAIDTEILPEFKLCFNLKHKVMRVKSDNLFIVFCDNCRKILIVEWV